MNRQVLAVILFATAVRAVLSVQLELTSVESYLWLCSRRPALGYFDYPGMIAWMVRVSTALFGHSVLGVRAVTILASGATVWLVYLTGRRLYDERVGRLAAILAALVPLFFAFGAEATPDAPCLLFWSATVWALACAFSGDSPRWWWAAGVFLGLAMDSKYHAVFLGLGVLGFLLCSPEHRAWLRRPDPWIGVVLALLAFSPTLIWNARNGWQSFVYQGLSRFRESGFQPAQLWRFPQSQLLLLTPFVCAGTWGIGLWTLGRWRRMDWRSRFLTALGAPMLVFFFLVIFTRPVRGHWAAPAYLTLLILSAEAVQGGSVWGRRLYWGSAAALAVGWLSLPILMSTIPTPQRRGWAALGARVAERKPDFILANEYHLASQLGYQLRMPEAWEQTPAGRPSKNFPNWWREEEHRGKNAVIVIEGRRYPQELARIAACFERVGPPEDVVVPRIRVLGLGEDAKFSILSAWGYKGPAQVEPRAPPSDD
ncbi:MAG TPA: glycosyltransferase family 39 protein [Planctomycetota bacterium]|nr:glycosyltransferase family 39 protein [Planctomycetota bacterium]